MLRLAQGKTDAASAAIQRALGETRDRPGRAALLPAVVEIALQADDTETAWSACLELEEIASEYEAGMLDARGERALQRLVDARENLLVTGAAGSGKTTLLAALLSAAPERERIVTIEDVAELRIRHPHHVRLEARQANLEGAGGVDLARLVREALRMRPDRLVVGECRGAEVRELLTALNTGHDGGAGTLHANGVHDVPARLEALGALAGLDDTALARQVVSAIGVVIHVGRDDGGVRRVVGSARPVLADGRLGMEPIPWD